MEPHAHGSGWGAGSSRAAGAEQRRSGGGAPPPACAVRLCGNSVTSSHRKRVCGIARCFLRVQHVLDHRLYCGRPGVPRGWDRQGCLWRDSVDRSAVGSSRNPRGPCCTPTHQPTVSRGQT